MLKMPGINVWKRTTARKKQKIETTATAYVQNEIARAFKYILKQTPQQTGDLAHNWRIAVGRANVLSSGQFFTRNPDWPVGKVPYVDIKKTESGWSIDKSKYEKPRYAGHPGALETPRLIAAAVIPKIKWNSRVAFINDTPYAYELTQPGNTMGKDEPFEFRDANIQRTNKGMLDDGQWRIMTAVKMRFRI